jgi:hypothetical protein
MVKILYTSVILCFAFCLPVLGQSKIYHIYFDDKNPQVKFAVSELMQELSKKAITVKPERVSAFNGKADGLVILVTHDQSEIKKIYGMLNTTIPDQKKPQSYSIRVNRLGKGSTISVFAKDANGAMYGVMDITEAISLGKLNELTDEDKEPFIENRGIKFNISLDMRTPTYSGNNDANIKNIPEMWSMDFWTEMLDHLARDRYNVISLWNLHPFPSIVKVPEYPDVALNDVYMNTKVAEGKASDRLPIVVTKDNHIVVKKMTIDEKIKFWQKVMQYGKDRGIAFQWYTWNIFTHGTEGKYGIDDKQTNEKAIAYFRASVRELALTYPLLQGVGITAGEHMENLKGEYSNENWLWKTYGEGILDAKKINPNLKIQLIHRFHLSSQKEILTAFKGYKDEFSFSFKYLYAHMYSDTKSEFMKPALLNLAPNLKMWLELRNDDIYSFRWGDPDFAREFVKNLPPEDKLAGYYMGSDGYALGREFLSTEPETPRQLVMKKQWYMSMLWGRLSFDPSISNEHFKNVLGVKFPAVSADKMFKASQESSKIFPEVTRFFWGDIDVKWFPEACKKNDRFYNIYDFIMQTTMPGTPDLNIKMWRELKLNGKEIIGKTPFKVANSLESYAKNTLSLVKELRQVKSNSKELRLTLGDYEAFAHLGNYYAEKIRGATNIALYDTIGVKSYQDEAITHLEKALNHWKKYGVIYAKQNVQPIKYGRAGIVDIQGSLTADVAQDIEMAKNWKVGTVRGPIIMRKELNFRE